MATVSQWTPYGVALDLTATSGTVTRTSATQYTVAINVSWKTHWSGAQTNYGMSASSGGANKTISSFGSNRSSGSASLTGTYSISGNGSASKTITVTFKNYEEDSRGNETKSSTKSIDLTVSVPEWTSYTITYHANGGTGAPSSQKKWKDQALTLSSTKPKRDGYTFLGWAASSSATTATYSAGGTYPKTSNANATLYAIWKIITFSVTYNANGGNSSSIPGAQTKEYGKTLALSTKVPTRTDYEFLGWATSKSATTAQYKAGGNYTANAATTLYAVWKLAYVKPSVEVVELYRYRSEDSMPSDDGDTIWVRIRWATTYDEPTIVFRWSWVDEDGQHSEQHSAALNRSNGYYDSVLGDDLGDFTFDLETTYELSITVSDSGGSTTVKRTIPGMAYTVDYLVGGKGAAFGKPAELENTLDIAFKTRLRGGLDYIVLDSGSDLNFVDIPGFYVGKNVTDESVTYDNCPITDGTFTLEVKSAGPNGQLQQIFTLCDKNKSAAYERWYYTSAWGNWYGSWIYPDINTEKFKYVNDAQLGKPACRKDGRIVEIRGIVTPVNAIAASDDTHNIITVPVGYRPNSPIYVTCDGGSDAIWTLRVNTDGTVGLSRYRKGGTAATTPVGAWLAFQVTYIADK